MYIFLERHNLIHNMGEKNTGEKKRGKTERERSRKEGSIKKCKSGKQTIGRNNGRKRKIS